MALTLKNLAAVTFDTGKTLPATLFYKPDPGKCALVKSIILTNKHATSPATVNVTLVAKGNAGPDLGTTNLCPPNLSVSPGNSVILDTEITLTYVNATYEKIEVKVESSSGLPFSITISGIERDI